MAALKAGELRSLLDRFAVLTEASRGNEGIVSGLRLLRDVVEGAGDSTLAAFMKKIEKVAAPNVLSRGATTFEVAEALEGLRAFLSDFAKKDLLKGLDSLIKVLRANQGVAVGDLVAAWKATLSASQPNDQAGPDQMNETLINEYVKRLEAALGGDEFESLFAEIRADKRVQQPEAVEIASRFYSRT